MSLAVLEPPGLMLARRPSGPSSPGEVGASPVSGRGHGAALVQMTGARGDAWNGSGPRDRSRSQLDVGEGVSGVLSCSERPEPQTSGSRCLGLRRSEVPKPCLKRLLTDAVGGPTETVPALRTGAEHQMNWLPGGGLAQSVWTTDSLTIAIDPQHRCSARRGLEPLLNALNASRTVCPGTDLRLVYEFTAWGRGPTPPTAPAGRPASARRHVPAIDRHAALHQSDPLPGHDTAGRRGSELPSQRPMNRPPAASLSRRHMSGSLSQDPVENRY